MLYLYIHAVIYLIFLIIGQIFMNLGGQAQISIYSYVCQHFDKLKNFNKWKEK